MNLRVLDKVKEEESRTGLVEVDAEIAIVDDRDAADPLLDDTMKDHILIVAQQFEGELHVRRGEWHTVAPGDALAQPHSDALEVGRHGMALCQPWDLLTGVPLPWLVTSKTSPLLVVQIQELEDRFVEDSARVAQTADGVGVEVVGSLDLVRPRVAAGQDQRLFAGRLFRCEGGNSQC